MIILFAEEAEHTSASGSWRSHVLRPLVQTSVDPGDNIGLPVHALLLRLSAIDSEAEAAVRIIAFFDELVERRADLNALVRSAASLADAEIGITDSSGRMLASADGTGRALTHANVDVSLTLDLSGSHPTLGHVWLSRNAGSNHFDELILERLGAAVGVVVERENPPAGQAQSQSLQLLTSGYATEAERERALRSLGLRGDARCRCLAIDQSDQSLIMPRVAAWSRQNNVLAICADIAGFTAVMVADVRRAAAEALLSELGTTKVGVGPAVACGQLSRSWVLACRAMTFARCSEKPAAAWSEDLGPVALLATLNPAEIDLDQDVKALEELSARPSGNASIEAFVALCRFGSMRTAANSLYLHHSSVAYRVAQVEAALGYSLHDNRFRALLAVHLWRLRHASTAGDTVPVRAADHHSSV